jgi:uncharacterized protein
MTEVPSSQEPTVTAREPAFPDTPEKLARRRRWRRIKWTVRGLVVLFAAGYLKFVGFDSRFYYPSREDFGQPADYGLRHEDVHFRTSDGLTLHGWWLPAQPQQATLGRAQSRARQEAEATNPSAPLASLARGVLVHFHGNAANISNHLPLIEWAARAGYHVLMFDYRGFGSSEGSPTRAGTIRDGHAALDYALARPETHGLPVFFYGQSLGGAVAIVVAAERPEVAAVVAESPFASYRGIAACHVARLVGGIRTIGNLVALAGISAGFDPIDYVKRLTPRPLLVIAAGNDEICFPQLARELYDAACEPKALWEVPGAGHLEIVTDAGTELTARVTSFLGSATKPP